MAALVAQVQRGVIGVLRQSSVATLYSLALRLKVRWVCSSLLVFMWVLLWLQNHAQCKFGYVVQEVGVLDGHSSSSSSRTTELEAVADVVSERDMSADILDGLIPSSSSQGSVPTSNSPPSAAVVYAMNLFQYFQWTFRVHNLSECSAPNPPLCCFFFFWVESSE
jgi:hypothetical protein